MCCTLIVNVKAKTNCKIINKVVGVVSWSQSIFCRINYRASGHAYYWSYWTACIVFTLVHTIHCKTLIHNTGLQDTWNAVLRMYSYSKVIPETKQ